LAPPAAAIFTRNIDNEEEDTLMFRKLMNTTDDLAITILRLTLGVVFFAHGAQKALGWFGGFGFSATMGFFTQQAHIPAPFAFLAICAEFLGGIGLLLGLLGRVAAFGIACNMVVAIAMVHRHFGLFANWYGTQKGEGIEYHLLAIAIALAIMIKGSGDFSVDRALSK
jgi:putative oxidoreductase